MALKKLLSDIAAMLSPTADSYASDDPSGAIETAYSVAVEAIDICAEVERLAAQAAPSEPQIDSRFPAAHYGHDLQPSQAPVVQAVQTEVRFKYESMKPIDGYDAIYAEYATTFGRYPDDFMSRVVRQTKEDLFMWWGAHREKIRAGLVLLAAQEDASSGATTQAVRMLTKEELTDLIASTVAALTKGQT
jgi:hypothetical protein